MVANKKQPKKPGVSVGPQGKQWAVKREGSNRASSLHDTQKQAEEKGRNTARREKTEFQLKNQKGQIREKDSYGNDPNPPKDKR